MAVVDLARALGRLPAEPRVVVSGNHATPWHTLGLVDAGLGTHRLRALDGQRGLPDRDGVTPGTSSVGRAVRRHPRLRHVPSRSSLVPEQEVAEPGLLPGAAAYGG